MGADCHRMGSLLCLVLMCLVVGQAVAFWGACVPAGQEPGPHNVACLICPASTDKATWIVETASFGRRRHHPHRRRGSRVETNYEIAYTVSDNSEKAGMAYTRSNGTEVAQWSPYWKQQTMQSKDDKCYGMMQTARKIVELPGDCKGIGHEDISTCTKAQINYAKATVCKAGVQLANGTKQSD